MRRRPITGPVIRGEYPEEEEMARTPKPRRLSRSTREKMRGDSQPKPEVKTRATTKKAAAKKTAEPGSE